MRTHCLELGQRSVNPSIDHNDACITMLIFLTFIHAQNALLNGLLILTFFAVCNKVSSFLLNFSICRSGKPKPWLHTCASNYRYTYIALGVGQRSLNLSIVLSTFELKNGCNHICILYLILFIRRILVLNYWLLIQFVRWPDSVLPTYLTFSICIKLRPNIYVLLFGSLHRPNTQGIHA